MSAALSESAQNCRPTPARREEARQYRKRGNRLSLTVREAAAAMGLREGTVRDLIRRRELAAVRIGGGRIKARWVLLVEDLNEWLERNRRPARWEGGR